MAMIVNGSDKLDVTLLRKRTARQDAAKAKKKPTELALHKVRIKSHELSRGSARSASAADLRVRRSNAPGMAAGWLELPIQPILTVTEII
ncbi:Uncharacterized protein DBV15_06295 [Temnothorax longispinosus]|uniref:Uncharacterized protein n=1 Tax=Temnothorax longispinosus TaxID=300112 RepID=A0A4S2KFL8_9HYME|nr:Uncharacterized protein DBV15_06295 [Temnothorax longispinosus]